MTNTVFCTFQVPGFHCWPHAPERYAYLGLRHRHVFHVRVEVEIIAGRTVEFIELKSAMLQAFTLMGNQTEFGILDFGGRSCEQLCADLQHVMSRHFKFKRIEVSEDGENGASYSE